MLISENMLNFFVRSACVTLSFGLDFKRMQTDQTYYTRDSIRQEMNKKLTRARENYVKQCQRIRITLHMLSDGFYPFVIILFQSAIWKVDLIAYLTLSCDQLSCLSLPHVFTIFNRIRNNYELIHIADFMISKSTHRLNENGELWRQNACDEDDEARIWRTELWRNKNDNGKNRRKKPAAPNAKRTRTKKHDQILCQTTYWRFAQFFLVFFGLYALLSDSSWKLVFARDKSCCEKSINANLRFLSFTAKIHLTAFQYRCRLFWKRMRDWTLQGHLLFIQTSKSVALQAHCQSAVTIAFCAEIETAKLHFSLWLFLYFS